MVLLVYSLGFLFIPLQHWEDRQLDYQPHKPETDSRLLIWHVCAKMGLQMPLSEFIVTCDHTLFHL